jgi:DivIVA domain-containing protein
MDDPRKSQNIGNTTKQSVLAIDDAEAIEQSSAGRESDRWPPRPPRRVTGAAERERLLEEARTIEFPVVLRGYHRGTVDRYLQRVNRLVAELEISSSPESAVRHALAEVSEEAGEVLRRARQRAEDVIARCRAEADDKVEQAEREAKETLEAAQHEANETREGAKREAHELREMTAIEAEALRETAQHESGELRETTMRQMAELREAGEREAQQLRATGQRDADRIRSNARREADETLERAAIRNRQLATDAEAMKRECRRLAETVRLVGEHLVAIGEGRRFPRLATELLLVDDQMRELAATPVSDTTATPSEPADR